MATRAVYVSILALALATANFECARSVEEAAGSSSSSQPVVTLSLHQAVEKALIENPDLRNFRLDVGISEDKIGIARCAPECNQEEVMDKVNRKLH